MEKVESAFFDSRVRAAAKNLTQNFLDWIWVNEAASKKNELK